ncbi:MAG: glycoside hydrolase family 127 protein [Clostridiaceae bacterium]|nr:glycoside hydrolase family 127 protein [Clostridiaceae bacterium]
MDKPHGKNVLFSQVKIDDAFWSPRIAVNRQVTLAHEYEMCRTTGRLDAFKLDWKPGMEPVPHIFWDSDVAKWVEAASYALAAHPDPELEQRLDEVTALIASAQQADGYLNTHFTAVEPDKRFTNLRDWHELYCAGHLIEAGVAHAEATGKRTLLDAVCRYADLLTRVFGTGDGQLPGYPGHEEIELALVKLYHATGQRRYLELSRYFIDQRGRQPHYFELESARRGETARGDYSYCQAHLPVRQQETVTGHAVRAMYLYAGMADIARETGDQEMAAACERLWNHLTLKQMYLTGGIGASRSNEGFLDDYDLPDDTAYCETCAGIGLIFWARRMLQLGCDRRYADVLERALYNNVLAGSSLDGRSFFYDNPLASYGTKKDSQGRLTGETRHVQRSEWFGCACCPPNYASLVNSLGDFLYTVYGDNRAAVHLYIGGEASLTIGNRQVMVRQQTRYPWDGQVTIQVTPDKPAAFQLALRIPGWCQACRLQVNGQDVADAQESGGYRLVARIWHAGDQDVLTLEMPVRRIYAHPSVRACQNKVAIQRGPLVYCAEQSDQSVPVRHLYLPEDAAFQASFEPELLGGLVAITGDARVAIPADSLYGPASQTESCPIRLIPYYAWNNRQPGDMRVWLPVAR